MTLQPSTFDLSSGPAWWRHPVTHLLVLAVAGTAAACLGGLTVAAVQGVALHATQTVEEDLDQIHLDLMQFRNEHDAWPNQLSEVYAQLPVDPWGRTYVFTPANNGRDAPDVLSLGADGWPGGGDASADLWMSDRVAPLWNLPRWGES